MGQSNPRSMVEERAFALFFHYLYEYQYVLNVHASIDQLAPDVTNVCSIIDTKVNKKLLLLFL